MGVLFIRLRGKQDDYHQNGIGEDEIKIVYTSGAEFLFDGDTHELVTDTDIMGTYNYINATSWDDNVHGVGSFIEFGVAGAGHMVVDVVPYWILGDTRGDWFPLLRKK